MRKNIYIIEFYVDLVKFSFSFLIKESTSKAFFDDYIHNKIVLFGKKFRYSLI